MPDRPSSPQLSWLDDLDLSYPEQGATAWPVLPPGYRHQDRTVTLGAGSAAFARAGAGLMSWQVHRRAGLTVAAQSPVVVPHCGVLLTVGWWPASIAAPCRVVHVVDAPGRRGFAYGTLAGHPERGEELFLLTMDERERVRFSIRAFSRPATLLTRLGGPVSTAAQTLITRRYLRSMRALSAP